MEIKIDEIIIKKRIRKNIGDLKPLMESMSKFGQLSSIVVNSKMQLLAGNRRLEAARQLGWTSINGVIIDPDNKGDQLELEIDENAQRKDLSADEISDAYRELTKLRRRNIFVLFFNFIKKSFNKIIYKLRKKKQKNNFY